MCINGICTLLVQSMYGIDILNYILVRGSGSCDGSDVVSTEYGLRKRKRSRSTFMHQERQPSHFSRYWQLPLSSCMPTIACSLTPGLHGHSFSKLALISTFIGRASYLASPKAPVAQRPRARCPRATCSTTSISFSLPGVAGITSTGQGRPASFGGGALSGEAYSGVGRGLQRGFYYSVALMCAGKLP